MNHGQQPQSSSSASTPAQQRTPLPAQSTNLPRPDRTTDPLSWLWPGRIPQSKLTLLDGSPGCGTTLFTITLAACVSKGLPLPDGTPCMQGNVLFITPHDNFRDTLRPRLRAAGAHENHIFCISHVPDSSSNDPRQTRPFSLVHDLTMLESTITSLEIVLLILDPYTAIPGWRRALPALIELAQDTHCAIVLTRSLSRAPADPLHPHAPASPVLTAARSHLLLAPDPADDQHCLLLTPKHTLCVAPSILAYTITPTQQNHPILTWLPAPDAAHFRRLCTGPIRSPHRQAILRYLREQPDPRPVKDILHATSYDYEAGRKMLVRMKMAGELVSPAGGLYTTSDHPCLAHSTNNAQTPAPSSPVPVPNVPADSDAVSTPIRQSDGTPVEPSVESSAAVPGPSQNSSTNNVPTVPPSTCSATTLPPQAAIPTSQTHTEPVPNVPAFPGEIALPREVLTQTNTEPVPNVPAASDQSRALQKDDLYPLTT